jgi:hypothetical protein
LANGLDLLTTAPAGTWEGEVSLADPDADLDADLDAQGDLEADFDTHLDADGDPGLHLDDLDSADSLDQTATSHFGQDGSGNDLDDDASDDSDNGTDDGTDADDLAGQPALGSAFGADDLTEVHTGINDDTGIQDVDDLAGDHTDADQASLTVDSPDPADGHDYLDHQITDHELDDQHAGLDDLNDVQDFDEFDA